MSNTTCRERSHSRFAPRVTVVMIIFVALAIAGCGSSMTLTSQWAEKGIQVDGNSSDWENLPTRIAGPDLHVGVKNDTESLYFCLSTSNRSTQFQMLALGTTVWFDPEGTNVKTFGIRFPLPGLFQGRRLPPPGNTEEMRRVIDGLIMAAQRQFEIIGPKPEERKKFADRQARGVDVHLVPLPPKGSFGQ